MQINLSKFKKVSEDANSATLKHPDGHHFRIAKSALSKQMQSELSSIPVHLDEGGMAQEKNFSEQPQDKPQQPIVINVGQPAPQAAPQMAPPPGYDETNRYGTPENSAYTMLTDPGARAALNPTQLVPQLDAVQGAQDQRLKIAASEDAKAEQAKMAQAEAAANFNARAQSMGINPIEGAAPQMPSAPAPQPIPTGGASTPGGASTGITSTQQMQPPEEDPYQAQLGALGKGIDEQKFGLAGEARALGEQGRKDAAAIDVGMQQQQKALSDFQANNKAFQEHQQAFMDDYQKGHIDPNRVLSNMGTMSKISTAIGLILGGIGGGLTHTENPVMTFLQERINNDVKAQEAELGKKKNLLEANRQFYGDMGTAIQATTVQQMGIVSSQLKKAAAEAQDPLAKSRALQAAGQLDERIAPMLGQMAMRKTLMQNLGGQQGQGAQLQDPAKKILLMKKLGYMDEKDATEAFKNLGALKEQQSTTQQYLNDFDEITKMTGNGLFSPNKRDAAIKLLAGRIEKIAEGRYNEDAAKNIAESMFPKKSDMSQDTINFKRSQGLSFLQGMSEPNRQVLKAYGVEASPAGPYSEQGVRKFQEKPPVIK